MEENTQLKRAKRKNLGTAAVEVDDTEDVVDKIFNKTCLIYSKFNIKFLVTFNTEAGANYETSKIIKKLGVKVY